MRRQIAAVEHAGERMEELRKEQKRLAADFEKLAADLTARRASAARKLEKRVEAELAQLAMERTVFRVAITPPRGPRTAPTGWNSWSPRTWARSRARWRRWLPAARFRA